MKAETGARRPWWPWAAAAALLIVFGCQMFPALQLQSLTWDEAHHLFDGYNELKHGDYGLNPEVPPLVKMLAAAPLLGMHLWEPTLQGRLFGTEAYFSGWQFVARNDRERLLLRAHIAASLLAFLLGGLIFVVARRLFGDLAAVIALALYAFDPNFLAHGALVTTDTGISLFLFATMFAFYCYLRGLGTDSPRVSWARVALVGVLAGLSMATKYTGVIAFGMMVVVAAGEWLGRRWEDRAGKSEGKRDLKSSTSLAWRLVGAIAVSGLIAWVVLWAFYGFRYAARPVGLAMNPLLVPDYLEQLKPYASPGAVRLLGWMAHVHLLPEGYIYGLANTKITANTEPGYFFGHAYPLGHWVYFPAAFLIKSTLAFMILLVVAAAAVVTKRLRGWRELLFLLAPVGIFMAMVLPSEMNIGHRHILPIYPFLMVLAGGGAAAWIEPAVNRKATGVRGLNPAWLAVVVALLVWQAVSSLRVFPAYMAYANEAWGGPSKTHLYLSDANVDWAQQLKAVKKYLDGRGDPPCWFAYFAYGAMDPNDYGVHCRVLPTMETLYWQHDLAEVPAEIDGPVLISDGDLESLELGSGKLNPYDDFRARQPVAVIQYGVDVYDGHFAVPLAAALVHAQRAADLVEAAKTQPRAEAEASVNKAATEAGEAMKLAPDNAMVEQAMGDVLAAEGKTAEAHQHYVEAVRLAETIEPEFQKAIVPGLKKKAGE